MKTLATIAAAAVLILPTTSSAAVGYFNNFYVITSTNGGSNVFNQALAPPNELLNAGGGFSLDSDNFNPPLGDFGIFDVSASPSQSLALRGFQFNTWNDGGDTVENATLFYRVTRAGDTPGSYSTLTASGPISISGNDRLWEINDATIDLTNGRPNGEYTIEFYIRNSTSFTGNGGGTFEMGNWNPDNGPSATFTIIPEPTSALLAGFGLLALLRRRR